MQVDGHVSIEVEFSGAPGRESRQLLIMELRERLTGGPARLVRLLGEPGCPVADFDHGDPGLNQGDDALGVPNLGKAALYDRLRPPVVTAHTLAPMADSAVADLDPLVAPAARHHLVNRSADAVPT